MALQILARLPSHSPIDKVDAINSYLYDELHMRFPPKSLWTSDIDLFTFLPAVLDSRKGVCLGTSILILSLAQRLSLELQAVTPPGHIYLRLGELNIETTARGIHIPTEEYLGINLLSIQQRTIKEVIGLAHMNQAAVFWKKQDHLKAKESYRCAMRYVKEDPLLLELMGYTHLFLGEIKEGEELLRRSQQIPDPHHIWRDKLSQEYLAGHIDVEGIKTLFKVHEEETREAHLKRKEEIQELLRKSPQFLSGLFHLAIACLELHQEREAIDYLELYHQSNPFNPTSEYYLAGLFTERANDPKAWHHLRQGEALVHSQGHYPKCLKTLRKELSLRSPE